MQPSWSPSLLIYPRLPSSVGGYPKLVSAQTHALLCKVFHPIPSLSASFPQYSGLLTIHSTPAPTTLLPPSYRFSELRGLHTGGGTGTTTGGGENNLAFKCMRKRFVIETLHLDIEGGVSERRTAPPTGACSSVDALCFLLHLPSRKPMSIPRPLLR
jgi:hypothetical protein